MPRAGKGDATSRCHSDGHTPIRLISQRWVHLELRSATILDVADRDSLRATFEVAADLYDRARPEYPDTLFDALIELTDARPGDHVLEIGCGTGQATRPLSARGLRITCLEIGARLAALARENLGQYEGVHVINESFEAWRPPLGTTYDLVIAATSWHWIDPVVKYRKAWELLRPGGNLAFWSATHVFPDGGDPFFHDLQEVYVEIGEGMAPEDTLARPSELSDDVAEIEATGLFERVSVRRFDWEIAYDAQGYIDLLETFSGHIAMQPWQRERLFAEIRQRLAARPDGRLRRHWGVVLHVARRRDDPQSVSHIARSEP